MNENLKLHKCLIRSSMLKNVYSTDIERQSSIFFFFSKIFINYRINLAVSYELLKTYYTVGLSVGVQYQCVTYRTK